MHIRLGDGLKDMAFLLVVVLLLLICDVHVEEKLAVGVVQAEEAPWYDKRTQRLSIQTKEKAPRRVYYELAWRGLAYPGMVNLGSNEISACLA